MNIEGFKDNCLNDIITDQDNSKKWHDLKEAQELYGNEYKMRHKYFRGRFCPNCDNKLKKEFMFRNKYDGTNHYIFKCSCGYKYAQYWHED